MLIDLSVLGDAQAQFGLGLIFEGGHSVLPEAETAAELCLPAAEQDISKPQLSFRSLYEKGNGVSRNLGRAAVLYLGDDGLSVRIHAASFRSEKEAECDWQILQKGLAELLEELGLHDCKLDFWHEDGRVSTCSGWSAGQ